jgi:hypothetical protein
MSSFPHDDASADAVYARLSRNPELTALALILVIVLM